MSLSDMRLIVLLIIVQYILCFNVQVFGEKAFEKYGKYFISLHLSDQHPGTHRKMLVFKFALPDANNMADMTRLVALVPYYIDLIGRYKLSPQVGGFLFSLYSLNQEFNNLEILDKFYVLNCRLDRKRMLPG